MINYNFEDVAEKVYLVNLDAGHLFKERNDVYIKTEITDEDDTILCIKIDNGEGVYFHRDSFVYPVHATNALILKYGLEE